MKKVSSSYCGVQCFSLYSARLGCDGAIAYVLRQETQYLTCLVISYAVHVFRSNQNICIESNIITD